VNVVVLGDATRVTWNATGTYISVGANANIIGRLLAKGYVSTGANSTVRSLSGPDPVVTTAPTADDLVTWFGGSGPSNMSTFCKISRCAEEVRFYRRAFRRGLRDFFDSRSMVISNADLNNFARTLRGMASEGSDCTAFRNFLEDLNVLPGTPVVQVVGGYGSGVYSVTSYVTVGAGATVGTP